MTKKTDDKPWSDRDRQRSLEREHHMEALPGVVRNEVWRRAGAEDPRDAFLEYVNLARLLKRAYRAGQKAGST